MADLSGAWEQGLYKVLREAMRLRRYIKKGVYKMPETSTVASVEDDVFEAEVLESDKPVVVDFWAPWCGPCRMVSPIVEELSHEYGEAVGFRKMNTDENENTMMQYGITSIPTLIIFKGGREVNRLVGYAPKEQLRRQIDRSLAANEM